MKFLQVFFILFLCIKANAQIKFEPGYIIMESGEKKACLIKNVNWLKNPGEFEYKTEQGTAVMKGNIESVKEFSVPGVFLYERATVQMDISAKDMSNMTKTPDPVFREETVFLNVLVQGKANLYMYMGNSLQRFFYSMDGGSIEPLISKSYLTENNQVGVNDAYKIQLANSLVCNDLSSPDFERLLYSKGTLMKIFKTYNECQHSASTVYKAGKQSSFHLALRPRVNYSSLTLNRELSNLETDFGKRTILTGGVEFEYVVPFIGHKWSVVAEPAYQYFKESTEHENPSVSGGIELATIDYSSIEVPLGLRYYFFLNEKSKIYLNAFYVLDFTNKKSYLEYKRKDGSLLGALEVNARNTYAGGIGFRYTKLSAELRYTGSRKIVSNFSWHSDYPIFSFILGYTIF